MITPSGMGVFFRRLGSANPREISETLRLLQACGMREAYFMAEAADGHVTPIARLEPWGQACRDVGIDPWAWSFPGVARARGDQREIVDTLRMAWLALGARGVLGDFEAPHKEGVARVREERAMKLRDAMLAAFPETTGVGVSSYGILDFHPTLPIRALAHSRFFGMPQFYTVTPEAADGGIADWHAAGFSELVFALPCFKGTKGATAKELDAYLGKMLPKSKGRGALWSLPDLRRDMAPIIRKHVTACAR